MTNPMTTEEALRQAHEPWPMAALDAARIISRLEPRGYALLPIKIDEAVLERVTEQAFCERIGQPVMYGWLRNAWVQKCRTAIRDYIAEVGIKP